LHFNIIDDVNIHSDVKSSISVGKIKRDLSSLMLVSSPITFAMPAALMLYIDTEQHPAR
jgi:hypothetical protein